MQSVISGPGCSGNEKGLEAICRAVIDSTPSKKLKQKKRFGWKKFTFGAGLLLTLVWMFVPEESEKRTVLASGSGEVPLRAQRGLVAGSLRESGRAWRSFHARRARTALEWDTVNVGVGVCAGCLAARPISWSRSRPTSGGRCATCRSGLQDDGHSSFASHPAEATALLHVLVDEAMRVGSSSQSVAIIAARTPSRYPRTRWTWWRLWTARLRVGEGELPARPRVCGHAAHLRGARPRRCTRASTSARLIWGKKRVSYLHLYPGYVRASAHRLVEFIARSPHRRARSKCLTQGTRRPIELAMGSTGRRRWRWTAWLRRDAVCIVRPCAFGDVIPSRAGRGVAERRGACATARLLSRVALLVAAPERKEELLEAPVDGVAELGRTVLEDGRSGVSISPSCMSWVRVFLSQSPLLAGPGPYSYGLDGDREVMLGKNIAGTELGWCLGAGIKLLGRLGRA
ncbi:hypothetical protein DFH09DRAFT_1389933 [Mycena vulgaris]|nr:hypothetical protein DFH09DRAFT_1389933 [Mycena vulgaris]